MDEKLGCSRREFLQRVSMGAGAMMLYPLGSFGSQMLLQERKYYQVWQDLEELPDEEKLGIALVGLGNYASGQLAPALQETKLCRLAGIVTGTPAKEEQWAEQYGIEEGNIYNYENFDEIAGNDDIDIIYVVLPNSMHAEYTIRAAEAGKHVISEKPMATSAADCEAMIEACRDNNRRLSIGYRLHFEPHNEEMMRLGQEEYFGGIQKTDGVHSFDIGNDPDVWRLDAELSGGGPLMDIGIYVIQAAIYTIGEPPVAVTARQETTNQELFSEVEETIEWEMEFPGEMVAHGTSSYSERGNHHRVQADEGWFELEPAYSYTNIQGETQEGPMDFPQVNQQTLQMDAFADHILNGSENRVPGEMGLRDVKILYAIYEAAETGQRVELDL
ncbi:MAG: Gfo/Idh/MocA family oxidoreductase [Balneolaceae bacterium]